MFRSTFYHCLYPHPLNYALLEIPRPPKIMTFPKVKYLTFRNLFNRAKLCLNHSSMDNSCCFEQDGIVNLVKSASILQSVLINRYIINTSSTVNKCHVACLLPMDIVPLGILGY